MNGPSALKFMNLQGQLWHADLPKVGRFLPLHISAHAL